MSIASRIAASLALWSLAGCVSAGGSVMYRCERPGEAVEFTNLRRPGAQCIVIHGTEPAPPEATRPRAAPGPRASPEPAVTPESHAFLRPRQAVLQAAGPEARNALAALLQSAGSRRVNFLHFGDSHIQSGHAIDALRGRLQGDKGSAGRGMVFPYAMAKTYSQNDYASSFEGAWATANSIQQPPKLPVGVSGFVGVTSDARASFTLNFSRALPAGTDTVKVFFAASAEPYGLLVTSGGQTRSVTLTGTGQAAPAAVPVKMPALDESIRIEVLNASGGPGTFALHGVSLEGRETGILYHNLGVGGATFSAIEQQRLFEPLFAALDPHVVLLDWGTNDIIHADRIPPGHAELVTRTIRRIRGLRPDAVIVLTSVQDMIYRGKRVTVAADYARLMREIALRNGCLFFDWHEVAGGVGSMRLWQAAKLAQADGVHLTVAGYRLKGQLLAEAIRSAVPGHTAAAETTGQGMALPRPAAVPVIR